MATDLTERGAQLPSQRDFILPGAQPSLTLAYRIYEDATRSDDLIRRVDPIHPAFMPVQFKALSA
ncbi:hypothetical protein FGG78_42700 [Thioclava sp. BHET1]|nr:hypothetical protein FGG78_42700 [Thioclava sp. BHET1]